MEDGALRVVKTNPTDWRDLSDYWQLSMHDNFNGFISRMCFSYDETFFFTCGYDGNIFSYRYKPDIEPPEKTPFKCTPVLRSAFEVEDVDGYTNLSLDEFLIKAEQDRIDRIASERRRDYLQKIRVLRERFQNVLKRNDKLMSTQVIPRNRFEIDERISQHLAERFAADLALVKRKLEYNVEKSKVGMVKLKNRFADDLDVFPIAVKCVTKQVSVKTERQQKLSSAFSDMLEVIEQKILDDERNRKPPERIQVAQETFKIPERAAKRLEYFLMGLSPSTIEKGLGPKLARFLRKYRQRKERMEERRREWIMFNARKPVKGVNNPDDEAALAEAIETIGNFKLKTAPDYTVPKHLRQSTVKKYKQLLHARLNQYNLRHNLNMSIVKLRDDRVNLIDYLKEMKERLNVIQQEIGEDLIELSPPMPEMLPEDFPETNLDINVKLAEVPQTVQAKIVPIPKGDLLEREVLLMKKPLSTLYPQPRVEKGRTKKTVEPFINPAVAALCVDTDTPWEAEIRNYRLSRYLFEQQRILDKMNTATNKFDDDVISVSQKKIEVRRDGDLLDLHIISLNQELLILNNFEAIENKLQATVYSNMQEMLDMQDLISSLNGNIESNKRQIENRQEEEKTIQQQFLGAAADSKFYDFLRRIFKKKYKPPRVYNPDESSSSSESSDSSESEQLDAGSIDSRDFTVVRLDENVCPKGCDPALYAKTFELRTKRHGVELQIKDLRADIDSIAKEIATKTKKLKMIDKTLKESEKDLEAYQREKQQKINLVATTVVLKLNQLQHLVSSNQSSKVGDVLLFSKDTLSNLYDRVGQLHNETMKQKSKHKGNITHMTRMRTDCKHMNKHIAELKAQIKELMIIKFGQVVDVEDVEETSIKAMMFGSPLANIDDLEESALRKMVFELRVSQEQVDKLYKDEILLWAQIYAKTQVELAETIKGNTARLDLLGLLNKEKAELARTIDYQAKKREKDTVTESDILKLYGSDLEQLSNIVKNQRKELKMLQNEIARLKTKGFVVDKAKAPAKLPIEDPEIKKEDKEDELECTVDLTELAQEPLEQKIAGSSSSLLSMSTLNMAKSLVMELIDTIAPYSLTKFIRESLVNHLIMDILQRPSVEEVAENLQALLPIEPTEAQQELIETVAEQIFLLQQPEMISDKLSASSIVAEVIEKIIQTIDNPAEVVSEVLSELVSSLPLDYLLKLTTIKSIISTIISKCHIEEINKEELVHAISNTKTDRKMEMQLIMDKILEAVYGSGIDYLYFVEQ
ncbi:cilia- and flagella-associated protein 44-like [Photinus pyralis]|nr:cilia- and flagella-associated protein 44-like [Photinus pyralis]XP_031357854.1 cilia- and flagella-associated protein 44-like [Photinus pyralis]